MEIIMSSFPRRICVFLICSVVLTTSARAVILDWNSVAWSPGSISNSFDVDPSNPGNDITVTFSGDTGRFATDPTTGIQTPAIDSTMEGGTSPVQKSLDLSMGLTTNKVITITISFSPQYLQGVNNVSFSIFGINKGVAIDTITNILALGTDGTTQIAPTITNVGPAVQLSGTGLGQTLTGIGDSPHGGPGSGDGNATISFGNTPIQSITFSFQDGTTGFANSQIAISNLTFSPVPEINPAAVSAVSCLLAVGLTVLVNRRAKGTAKTSKPENS